MRALGWLLLLIVTGLIVIRWAGLDRVSPFMQAMYVVPYLTVLALLIVLVVFATGRRGLGLFAVLVFLAYFAALLPRWASSPEAEPQGAKLRVMTVNLHAGGADPSAVVRLVHRLHPDLLAVQELTEHEASALSHAGIGRYLPRHVLRAGPKASGSGLYAADALTHGRTLRGTTYRMAAARLSVGSRSVDVVSVHTHPLQLGKSVSKWTRDLNRLPPSDRPGAQLLIGDFNATDDQHEFRQLTHDGGYLDAAGSIGSGLSPTWHRWPMPPVQIDHALLDKRLTATEVRTDAVSGTDHKALTVDLVLS